MPIVLGETVNRIVRVLTRFGHTQVVISGETHDRPIILLHAMGLNLTSWAPNVEALSKQYKVIAVEYSQWLNDIIDSLELQEVNLFSCSMGGWIAHSYAINYPAAGIP